MKFFERFKAKGPEDFRAPKTGPQTEYELPKQEKFPARTEEEKQQIRDNIAEMKIVLERETLKNAIRKFWSSEEDMSELDIPELRTLREGYAFLRDHRMPTNDFQLDNLIHEAATSDDYDQKYDIAIMLLLENLDECLDDLNEQDNEVGE